MRSICLVLLFLRVIGPTVSGAEAREGDDAFAAGTAAFAEADYLRALSLFQQARDAGVEGPAVQYNIAVSHYKLGDYEQAGETFSLIVERYPAMRALARYNLGLVAEKLGDQRAAESHFRRALETSDDEKIRRLAQQRLRPPAAAAPPERRWYRTVSARVGHDDNVRLVSDEVALPSGQAADSMSTELWGLVTGPLSSDPGWRIDGSFYAIRYADASFFGQNYLRFALAREWRFGEWRAEIGPHLSYATLDGDGYEQRAGVGLRLERDVAPRTRLGVRYLHDEVGEGDDRFAFVDGGRDLLELRVDRRGARNRLTFRSSIESNDRGAAIASTRSKLSLRLRRAFNRRWTGEVEGAWRRSRYDDLAEPREEDLIELSVGVTREFPRRWELSGTVSVADNDSLAPFSYGRDRISIGLGKSFY